MGLGRKVNDRRIEFDGVKLDGQDCLLARSLSSAASAVGSHDKGSKFIIQFFSQDLCMRNDLCFEYGGF